MTIDEKLAHINSAYSKIVNRQANEFVEEFTNAEYAVIEAALDIVAGLCTILKERTRFVPAAED